MYDLPLIRIPPPLPLIETFYFYYSYVTLILAWLIAPLLFYVILTQSGNLKSFKWLVLNHCFWCLAFESLIGIVKPLLLLPAAGGIPLGFLRHDGNYKGTGVAALLGNAFASVTVLGLFATIANRYSIVFDTFLSKIFSERNLYRFIIPSSIGVIIGFGVAIIPGMNYNLEDVHRWALKDEPELEYYFNETSLFMLQRSIVDGGGLIIFIFLILIILSLILCVGIFIYSIKQNQTSTITKLQYSMISSSVIQIFITIVFLQIPVTMVVGLCIFRVPKSTNITCFIFSAISTHCLMEFIATLYFVSPYRHFLYKKVFIKLFPPKPSSIVPPFNPSLINSSSGYPNMN